MTMLIEGGLSILGMLIVLALYKAFRGHWYYTSIVLVIAVIPIGGTLTEYLPHEAFPAAFYPAIVMMLLTGSVACAYLGLAVLEEDGKWPITHTVLFSIFFIAGSVFALALPSL